jgi:hypothetical protein
MRDGKMIMHYESGSMLKEEVKYFKILFHYLIETVKNENKAE